jgi:hypothetical protein
MDSVSQREGVGCGVWGESTVDSVSPRGYGCQLGGVGRGAHFAPSRASQRVVTSRKHLANVRQSSRHTHSSCHRGQPVVTTRKKITGVAKPPLPRPARPSPFFTVLFLEANWGWPSRRQLVRNSFCFWSQHGLVSCAGGPCATSVPQAPVPRKSTATLRKSTAHRRSFSRPFRV